MNIKKKTLCSIVLYLSVFLIFSPVFLKASLSANEENIRIEEGEIIFIPTETIEKNSSNSSNSETNGGLQKQYDWGLEDLEAYGDSLVPPDSVFTEQNISNSNIIISPFSKVPVRVMFYDEPFTGL